MDAYVLCVGATTHHEAGGEVQKPGRSNFEFAADSFRDHGFDDRFTLVGHGVGAYWVQQEPYFVQQSPHVIEAGMVLAMEPRVGYWRLEDLVLVSADGPQILSTRFNTDEMFIMA